MFFLYDEKKVKNATPLCEIMGRNKSDKGDKDILKSWHNYTIYYYSIFKVSQNKEYSIFHSAIAGIKKKIFFDVGGFNPHFDKNIEYENEEFGYRIKKKNINNI